MWRSVDLPLKDRVLKSSSSLSVPLIPVSNWDEKYEQWTDARMEKAVDAAGCSGNEAIRRNLVHRILIPRVPLQNWVHSKRLMSCYTANSGLIHMAILIRSLILVKLLAISQFQAWTKMRESNPGLRVSMWKESIACVTRAMRETWQAWDRSM